jgi:hypothetical protein
MAQQGLLDEQSTRREEAAGLSRQLQEAQVELATQRERTAGAERRAADLTAQLQRQTQQSEREIAQLRESQAAAMIALRELEVRRMGDQPPPRFAAEEIIEVG